MNQKIFVSALLIFLLSASCAIRSTEGSAPTATALPFTATFPASPVPVPSETALPPPSQPTAVPVEGTTSTQINVRAEPFTAGTILGIIPANTKVDILGKDPGGNWYQILYPQGVNGKGWVTAQYVLVANSTGIPLAGGIGVTSNNGNVAIVQQQINVRSGPGTGFNSIGILNAQDVVNLVGKDTNGAWLQIEFSSGPDGKGWVNAAFVQARGVENLPVITEAGEAIGTGTPTGIPYTLTPTLVPAWADNDSATRPIASVIFEPFGTHTLIYTGDVSAPEGDFEDWIQFNPNGGVIFASLECNEGNNLQVKFLENGQPTTVELACGDLMKKIDVKAGSLYLIHVQAVQPTDKLQYIRYRIVVELSQ